MDPSGSQLVPSSQVTHVRIVDVGAMQNQITQLEKENAELKDRLAVKEKQLGDTILHHENELGSLKTLIEQTQQSEAQLQTDHTSLLEKHKALQAENDAQICCRNLADGSS